MKYSVIIPVYNRPDEVGELLESLCKQAFSDFEVIVVEDREAGIDLGQVIYDYVCTSLPLVRVHPDGECDPEVVKYLGGGKPETPAEPESENPFASLKTLLEKK